MREGESLVQEELFEGLLDMVEDVVIGFQSVSVGLGVDGLPQLKIPFEVPHDAQPYPYHLVQVRFFLGQLFDDFVHLEHPVQFE